MTYQTKSLKRKNDIGRKTPREVENEKRIFYYWCCGEGNLRKDCPCRKKKKEVIPYEPQGHASMMQDVEKEGAFPQGP